MNTANTDYNRLSPQSALPIQTIVYFDNNSIEETPYAGEHVKAGIARYATSEEIAQHEKAFDRNREWSEIYEPRGEKPHSTIKFIRIVRKFTTGQTKFVWPEGEKYASMEVKNREHNCTELLTFEQMPRLKPSEEHQLQKYIGRRVITRHILEKNHIPVILTISKIGQSGFHFHFFNMGTIAVMFDDCFLEIE